MSDKSRIEWTDATWNPVTGCTKVSDGCKHCYAERTWARLSAPRAVPNRYTGRKFTDVQVHDDIIEQPLHWEKPRRIFVNSMSDLFHPSVPDIFIREIFAIMAVEAHHTFQVLTKRPERMCELLGMWRDDDVFMYHDGLAPSNVWLGVSVEDQATADERIPLLLDTPAAVRWVSAEPLLGPVRFHWDRWLPVSGFEQIERERLRTIDWVVAGGESGPKARPMHPDWVRSLRDQCAEAVVPFLFKQWGEYCPSSYLPKDASLPARSWAWISEKGGPAEISLGGPFKAEFAHHELMARIGKKSAGRLLDGIQHDSYPNEVPF